MQNKLPKIIIGLFILISIYGIINFIVRSEKPKIYTIGKIYKKSASGKRGSTYHFKYQINNKEFSGITGTLYKFLTNDSGYIFLDVLRNDLDEYHVIEFKKVPPCLTLDNVPKNGWTTLPAADICK